MQIQGLNNNSSSNYEIGEAGGALGKDEFMKLLVTQMQNQDPMKPIDNTQMTAQLAQFSSLEQMQNLNTKFEKLQQLTAAAMSLQSADQPIAMQMNDGSVVEGLLEKIQWSKGETQFVVDGTAYPGSKVISLWAGDPAPEPVQQ